MILPLPFAAQKSTRVAEDIGFRDFVRGQSHAACFALLEGVLSKNSHCDAVINNQPANQAHTPNL